MTHTYSGGCQCGKVRYEVQMDIGEVLACNCSRCGRLGSLLAFAPATQFKLLSGDAPAVNRRHFCAGLWVRPDRE